MTHSRRALRRQLPHGLTDLFLEHAGAKTALEETLQHTFSLWGYTRVVPPTFEYMQSIATAASPQLEEEMYRFFDREGRMLALRTDFTVPIARIVGTRLYDQPLPMRFYYVGNVFRHQEPQAGRRREFTQAGIELIGAATPEADTEVLAVAANALQAMGIDDFQINLGQVAYLRAILQDQRLDADDLYRIEQGIARKNDVELSRALDDLGIDERAARAIQAIPHLCGDRAVLDEAGSLAPNTPAHLAIERLRRVHELALAEGLGDHVLLDLGEVRSMAYYTGVTFHGFVANLGFPICSGGRYDGLLRHFGPDLPAVGFALGVERAQLVAEPSVVVAPDVICEAPQDDDARRLVARARARGLHVEVDVLGRRGDDLLAHAQRCGIARVIARGHGDLFTLWAGDTTRALSAEQLAKEIDTWNRS